MTDLRRKPEGSAIPSLRFLLLAGSFCVYRLPPDAPIQLGPLQAAPWYALTRTPEEVSIVAPEGLELGPADREAGWSCLRIAGTLDFGAVGVIAGISRVLAEEAIPIFTISTYTTDYIFVRTGDLAAATRALEAAGHVVAEGDSRLP